MSRRLTDERLKELSATSMDYEVILVARELIKARRVLRRIGDLTDRECGHGVSFTKRCLDCEGKR